MEEREQINGITRDIATALNRDIDDVRRTIDRLQDLCIAELRVPYQYVHTEPSSEVAINHLAPNRNDEEPRNIPSYDEKIEWLRKKGALNRLLRNLYKKSHLDNNARRIYIESENVGLISSGFSWYCSDEGQSYWEGLNASYMEWYLRKIR